jgi:signal transduction histidine kinase/CheY-like chemotaxis protein
MHRLSSQFGFDLRASPRSLIPVLIAIALAITLANDVPNSPSDWREWGRPVGLLYGSSLVIWILDRWKPVSSRWFTSIALTAVAHVGILTAGAQDYLSLIAIPIALSAPLIGLPVAAVFGALETALLILVPGAIATGADPAAVTAAIAAIWGALGVLYAVYRPRQQVDDWLWTYFDRAQNVLEGERDERAALKQTLDDLAHANRQLALSNERIAGLRIMAEEAQKAKSTFVAKVSHEFRTPLNMIIGLVGLMVETPELYGQELPSPVVEDLHIIHRNCRHLSEMINDVLALSQAEAGRLALRREWVDLAEVVNTACDVVRPLLEKKSLDLAVEMPGDLPRIYCDRTRTRQVILNLISNAARFTEAGRITVQALARSQHVEVQVSDTGPGIAPRDAEQIFEPFCQGSGGLWRDKRGTGLGLSISKEFVKLHGGRIWLDSQLGVGSTFSFELPVSQPLELSVKPTRWIREDWVWRDRGSRTRFPDAHYRPRIIVCDASGDLAAAFARSSDQVEWESTQDLHQAAHALEQSPAHALVINTPSPGDLWPAVERAKQYAQDTPIIGCSVPPRLRPALEAHAADYLVKPVTRADLLASIRRVDGPVRQMLIVDDDRDVLQLWTRMLRLQDPTLEIVTATDGREALAQMRGNPPDLVLLDIVLPDMDGWQVLAIKAQDQAISGIPVILVSAQDPTDRPLASEGLLVAMGDGLTLNRILDLSLKVSAVMLRPD